MILSKSSPYTNFICITPFIFNVVSSWHMDGANGDRIIGSLNFIPQIGQSSLVILPTLSSPRFAHRFTSYPFLSISSSLYSNHTNKATLSDNIRHPPPNNARHLSTASQLLIFCASCSCTPFYTFRTSRKPKSNPRR